MKKYFLYDGIQQSGPFSLDELKNKNISKETLIWFEGAGSWKSAGIIEELQPLFTVIPPPIPAQPAAASVPENVLNKEVPSAVKLYSEMGIFLATFMGTPIAGAYLIGYNFKQLGDKDKYIKLIVYGVVITLGLFGLASFLPEKTPSAVYTGLNIGAIVALTNIYQKEILQAHKKGGGKFLSNWRAFGIGVLFAISVLAIIFSIIYAMYLMGIMEF